MKILQVCPNYYPKIGGVEVHVQNISERLGKIGSVTVGTTDSTGKLPSREVINDVDIRRFRSFAPKNSYDFSLDLNRFLQSNSQNFDIIHAHDYYSFPAFYAATSKKSCPFFFTLHLGGSSSFFRNLFRKPYRILGRYIVEKADAVICVSNFEKESIQKELKVKKEKIFVIPNGFNLEEFKEFKKEKQRNQVILSVGRAEKNKGMQHLIAVLPKMDENIILKIVGKGPYKKELIKLARKLHVEKRVCFLQDLSRRDLLKEYANADLFALLSNYESYGISVGDALCSKTPCIVACNSALEEWIDNENCFGIKCPIDQAELRKTISKTIGRVAESNSCKISDWNSVVERIRALYENY